MNNGLDTLKFLFAIKTLQTRQTDTYAVADNATAIENATTGQVTTIPNVSGNSVFNAIPSKFRIAHHFPGGAIRRTPTIDKSKILNGTTHLEGAHKSYAAGTAQVWTIIPETGSCAKSFQGRINIINDVLTRSNAFSTNIAYAGTTSQDLQDELNCDDNNAYNSNKLTEAIWQSLSKDSDYFTVEILGNSSSNSKALSNFSVLADQDAVTDFINDNRTANQGTTASAYRYLAIRLTAKAVTARTYNQLNPAFAQPLDTIITPYLTVNGEEEKWTEATKPVRPVGNPNYLRELEFKYMPHAHNLVVARHDGEAPSRNLLYTVDESLTYNTISVKVPASDDFNRPFEIILAYNSTESSAASVGGRLRDVFNVT